ncbi:MAG: aminodeoxychorismate lyase [Porticoccaceae bacterium]
MTDSMFFINGKPETSFHIRDRGLCYGHGVFETMALSASRIPLWQFHRQRLLRGLAALRIPLDGNLLALELQRVLDATPETGIVKLMITAGQGSRGYRATAPVEATRIFQWLPPAPKMPAGTALVTLQVCNYRLPHNSYLAGIKHLNRLDQVIAAQELDGNGQGLLLDVEGQVVEALSHNLFMRIDDRWLTPSLDRCGVVGVMRSVLIEEIFPRLSLNVVESRFNLSQLLVADEIFICNAIAGIQPVASIKMPSSGLEKNWHHHGETSRIRACLEEMYPCFIA